MRPVCRAHFWLAHRWARTRYEQPGGRGGNACDDSIIRTADYDYGFSDLDNLGFELNTGLAASDGQECRPSEFPSVTDVSRNRSRGNSPLPCEPDRIFGTRAKGVSENIRLVMLGVPGEETVYGVYRTKRYDEGERATADDLIASLNTRFGVPAREERRGDSTVLTWQRGASGADTGQCALDATADGGETFDDACGTLATAVLVRASNSPLVERIQTAIFDETGVMQALETTQARLRRMREAEDRRLRNGTRPGQKNDRGLRPGRSHTLPHNVPRRLL